MSDEPDETTAPDAAPASPGAAQRFERLWGTSPWLLAGHLAVILVAAYALSVMFQERFAPRPFNLILWLVGGAVLHDAVLLPAYSALNVVAAKALKTSNGGGIRRIMVLNHVRVPAVISGVLLLVFSPRIFAGQPQNYERALGHPPPDYLARWLAVTAALFVLSGLLFAVRRLRADPASPDPSGAGAAADAPR
ncbi:MAG: hypothetical protein J7513_17610 [Solirubrobacteraceae bacterium]|nr:hypothetical protein [Solirubrobacteraceae bacterium]